MKIENILFLFFIFIKYVFIQNEEERAKSLILGFLIGQSVTIYSFFVTMPVLVQEMTSVAVRAELQNFAVIMEF